MKALITQTIYLDANPRGSVVLEAKKGEEIPARFAPYRKKLELVGILAPEQAPTKGGKKNVKS